MLNYGLLHCVRNNEVADFLSLRECVAFVAIYNRAYPKFYNGIPKAVLHYGLLHFVRNDEKVSCHCEAVRSTTKQSIILNCLKDSIANASLALKLWIATNCVAILAMTR